jgi:hypothetical protein
VTALVAGALALVGTGCGKPPRSSTSTPDDPGGLPKGGDPWVATVSRLKKETDLATCKQALGGLKADFGTDEGKKLPVLSDEAFAALSAVVPLAPGDINQVRSATFTDHDAVYLGDCFYLRDAARALALDGLPPERQAQLALEWVCRQVYLSPWLFRQGPRTFTTTVLPPTAVLRRGFGSGLERMYVFLALLQQLELDACLIGGPTPSSTIVQLNVPGVKEVPDTPEALAAVAVHAPRGPFWAVGVRVGSDVRLFDPWRGQPCPVTLAQLKSNPDTAKAWFEDKANASGVTLEDAKQATGFLAVPVSSLSPRMSVLEAHLRPELGVKLAFDARALRAGFPDPKPAFWNPPEDPCAYGRAARSYLPVERGGDDQAPQSPARFYESSLRDQIPPTAFSSDAGLNRLLEDLPPLAADRIRMTARIRLAVAFVEPPNPRERIQRGQFQEAARDLVAKQEMSAVGLERLRINKDADQLIKDWIGEEKDLYLALSRAQLNKDRADEAAATAAIEAHWKDGGVLLLLDRAGAEVGQAEAALLLALCKHEQAERAQVRLERATPAEAEQMKPDVLGAWRTALSAWKSYQQSAAAHAGFPGRAAHAKELAARAARFVEADAKK